MMVSEHLYLTFEPLLSEQWLGSRRLASLSFLALLFLDFCSSDRKLQNDRKSKRNKCRRSLCVKTRKNYRFAYLRQWCLDRQFDCKNLAGTASFSLSYQC